MDSFRWISSSSIEDGFLAIAIEFVNVIVRKFAVQEKYLGGVDGFARQDLPNYLEDEHLLRVGFMSTQEAFAFVEELKRAGLSYSEDAASDLAVITLHDLAVPSWLTVGECQDRVACWLSDEPPGALIESDTGILRHCRTFNTVEEIVSLFARSGVEVQQRETPANAEAVLLECERGTARIELEVFMNKSTGRPIGIWGRRNLARRTSIAADNDLLRELASALETVERYLV